MKQNDNIIEDVLNEMIKCEYAKVVQNKFSYTLFIMWTAIYTWSSQSIYKIINTKYVK